MGWNPRKDYHNGIQGIIESKQCPDMRCLDYYDESLGRRITGMKQKEKVMKEKDAQECGDREHGGRPEYTGGPKTLHFDMGDSKVPT